MYGFLYRRYYDHLGLFRDGNNDNLKYVSNIEEAKKWRATNSGLFETIQIKRPPNRLVDVSIPLKEGEPKKDYSDNMATLLTTGNFDTKMVTVMNQFLDNYCVDKEGIFYKRTSSRKMDLDNMAVLQLMKDTIEGYIRLTPIGINAGKDRETKKVMYKDWDISLGGDLMDVEYKVGTKKHKTNFFGIYAPQVRSAMFPYSDFNGHTLQYWQRDIDLRSGLITVVIGPRGGGKSWFEIYKSALHILKEITNIEEKHRGLVIHYIGKLLDETKQYQVYMEKMMGRLINWEGVYHSTKTKPYNFKFWDRGEERSIAFRSQTQDDPTRGLRPWRGILDEPAYYKDDKPYKTMIGTSNVPITLISTIDSTAEKNFFYETYLSGLAKQRNYLSIEELLHKLWTKYGMNKITSREGLQEKIDNGQLEKMRKEFYRARPLVSLHYTIDDIEFLDPEDKEIKIETAMARGLDFCLAEHYGEYMSSSKVFYYDGLLTSDTPSNYDNIVISYDEADEFDYPGLVVLGLSKGKSYVIESIRLDKEVPQKYISIKGMVEEYQKKTVGKVYLVSDCTRGLAYYREFLMHVGPLDCPIKYTHGNDVTLKPPFHLVGKKYLIRICKEYMFDNSKVVFLPGLDGDNGLFNEIDNFKKTNKGYKAVKGKDDQVMALLGGLYFIYHKRVKDEFNSRSIYGGKTDEEIYWLNKGIKLREEVSEQRRKTIQYANNTFFS